VRQRAKFEGWLKFELASNAEQNGAELVRVESSYSDDNRRADLSFVYNDKQFNVDYFGN
jgi:hypothetical protein